MRVAEQCELTASLLALARLCAWPSDGPADELLVDDFAFSLESVGLFEDGPVPFFLTQEAYERAAQVFSRWGVNLDDHAGRLDTFFGAWLVLCHNAAPAVRALLSGSLEQGSVGSDDLRYLQAVAGNDRTEAAALFPVTRFASLLSAEIAATARDLGSVQHR